jgi:hypothetical protein
VGTAIGAGVGAVAGGAYGLYKNWGSLFGGDKKEEAAAGATPATAQAVEPAYADTEQGKKEMKEINDLEKMGQRGQAREMAGLNTPEALAGYGGARAAGGPVVEGKSYLVGEKGPEIMTPQKSGKITPNSLSMIEGQAAFATSEADAEGNYVEDHAEGVKAHRNKSGEITRLSSGAGTTHFAGGKATRHDTASMMGYGESHDLETGAVTKKYDAGPMSTRETADATGKVTSRSASYDLGVAKVGMEEDLITGKKKATASATDATGKEQSVEGEDAQEVMGKLQVLLDAVDKANKSDSGSKIGGLSADNADGLWGFFQA